MADDSMLIKEIEEALSSFRWMDPHTHIDAVHVAARGLDDVLLYHMSISDLYAAGCPTGARMSEDPSPKEVRTRILEALPYLPKVQNTAIAWGVRIILADLYDWHEPVTPDNWERLHARIAERSGDPTWPREILDRAGIARTGAELSRRGDGSYDDRFDYALEWAFFTRAQWGQPDIPLFELERTWSATEPGTPIPVTFNRATAPPLEKAIRTVDDVRDAMKHYCHLIPYGRVLATASHISTDIDYGDPTDAEMADALDRRSNATDRERDIYASYLLHLFLAEQERHCHETVFQFSLAAEPLPFESASRVNQRTIAQLARIIARYSRLKFMCHVSSRHANQSLCTLARELPNFSLCGYWWHNFFPGAIRHVIEERLDMLPVNRQIGFFSDAYCADWTYAKVQIVRPILAEVLAHKVCLGQYTQEEAADIARAILHDSSVELLGMGTRG